MLILRVDPSMKSVARVRGLVLGGMFSTDYASSGHVPRSVLSPFQP